MPADLKNRGERNIPEWIGAITMNTDYSNGKDDKETLLKRMSQLGIDLYGAQSNIDVTNGPIW